MARVAIRGTIIEDPALTKFLFNNTAMSVVWLVARLWLGYKWLSAGLPKVTDPAWVQSGVALQKFWERAALIPEGARPQIAFEWYREFIQYLLNSGSYTWFAKLIVVGEVAVGAALVLGAFVGVAAFFGAFMNWNYMMAGSASINPMLFLVAILLILAWKVAGYIGLDYYLLPLLLGRPQSRYPFARSSPRVPAGGVAPVP